MQHQSGWIRQFHPPQTAGCPQLLIFPHAGAGASAYRHFSEAFSADFEVFVFQYPGRQDRAGEPALESLPRMAMGAFADFRRSSHNRGEPLMTFGHSMGALVSFEFVRLAEAAGMRVRQLAISAAVAPSHAAAKPPHPSGDEEILDELIMLEGTNADVFADREVMRLALPVIKGDYRAFDAYACPETVTVNAPVHVICGDRDPVVTMPDLYAWGKHTDSLQVTMFDGGHFFLNDRIDEIAELLTSTTWHDTTV